MVKYHLSNRLILILVIQLKKNASQNFFEKFFKISRNISGVFFCWGGDVHGDTLFFIFV